MSSNDMGEMVGTSLTLLCPPYGIYAAIAFSADAADA